MRIGLVVGPDFQMIGLSAIAAFEVANKRAGRALYELDVVSEEGGMIPSSAGMQVLTKRLDEGAYDTLIVSAGLEIPTASPGLVRLLRSSAQHARRIASICLGAFILGDAGLLSGRRATTHWRYATALKERFPSCRVDMDKIFIEDGTIWTSAGMTAGIDLVVGMIERDQGSELARTVARSLVMYHRRSGGQSQHSVLLELNAREDRVQRALNFARANLKARLGIEELALAASLSPRQFTRLFRAETGTTPAKAVELLRVEAAKLMLEQSRLPIEEIAREVGFENRERMRLAFTRVYGDIPRSVRNDAGPLATL
ncbi:transcriptional regulator GlxA family with amidase domain [Angulomicrobium tetraedrale]|uniref:Transcriptional regulator GlxA family with amidase domain n=1 Tax=Ancylobacter tetraedralis TaxID=217068 RepID=A0A839ZFT0_9HYPH|nr:GlxA family transcriptional regulator [Ancylobacter tetraedralis]MBB3773435.1 transcriptional regulator GlxA family with amidase domain [Ancylobacter tetraedralis]